VIVHVDTSALVDALTGPKRSLPRLRQIVSDGHRIAVSSIVLFEWWRGPRNGTELAAQEALLPREAAVPFTDVVAALAAELYRTLRKTKGREIDLAIGAAAVTQHAAIWTLNPQDFRDIPGLELL
jgi:predicted nucleic acid-binding protein